MKPWKYIAPGLYGLLIYTCIRLITDTASGYNVLLHRDMLTNAIEIVSSVAVGYLIFYVLRRFEKSRNQVYTLTIRAVLVEFGTLSLISLLVMNGTIGVMVATTDNGMDSHDFVIINIIPLLFILIIYAIRRGNTYLKYYINQQTELERIKRDKSETELTFLKSQYHPHFLFNALNTVYFQMDESVDQAKKTIEKLSDLLRYQLYEGTQEMVPLTKELSFIKKYVALQRERLAEDVQITINLPEPGKQEIYPLLVIPTIENAFKYVGGSEKYISIDCSISGSTIDFRIENSFNSRMNGSKYSGVGITNLKRRLELLYADRHTFETRSESNTFIAKLSLPVS